MGGKIDLENQRAVEKEEAIEFSKNENTFGFIECSSKTGENVEMVFKNLALAMLKKYKNIS